MNELKVRPFLLLLVLALLGFDAGERALAWQSPTNLLQNPGFEGDYYPWFSINEVQVAHGWTPWWRTRTDSDPAAYYFQPEYKQANGYIYPNRVHGGAAAQQWFTFHATHDAGMYQQVFNVTPGTRYRFTVWAQVWSSTEDDPNVSSNPAYPNLQVGIDPAGNWNPWSPNVVWSGPYVYYDHWGQLKVEAVAQHTIITVFMRSNPNWPVKHNDTYWDDAALVAVGESEVPVPPTAPPPVPPLPSPTSDVPPPPTPTCAPVPPDWVMYYVQRGDTLFSLGKRSGTTVDTIMSVNCLTSTTIHVGQALMLPRLPATATPSEPTRTIRPATATAPLLPTATTRPSATPTATTRPTATQTPTASATATEEPTAAPPTVTTAPPTSTPVPMAAATVTPTRRRPTIPPPSTPTPGSPEPPPTSTPSGGGARPCGAIAVAAGVVTLAGVFRFRRRRSSADV